MTEARNESPEFVVLPDGRRLAYALFGDRSGRPLLICHGDAQSRLGYRRMHDEALRRRVLLICPERPGYGLSDPAPRDYSFAGQPEDVKVLLDDIELTSSGVSAGRQSSARWPGTRRPPPGSRGT